MAKRCPYDFEIFQGEDFDFNATYKTSQGSIIPLTGYTAKMQARADYSSETPVLELDETDGLTIDEAGGKITVAISHEKSEAIPAGVYVYDLEITSPADKKTTFLFGKITVFAEVTR